MKHISILIPRGHTSLVNIEGTHQIFSEVNNILINSGRPPVFNIQLVGLSKETRQTTGLFSVIPDVMVNEVKETSLIIIPAIHGNPEENMKNNSEFIPWIINRYENGAEIASFCIGSFFLAGTGLLKGKRCTTHWASAGEFRKMFPDINLLDDKIMTEQDGIYTSGGAYSYLNLLLYLIEKYAGRDVAVKIAKTFMIDIDKNSQSPFIMFSGQKDHKDGYVIKAQEYIEKNYAEKLTVNTIAAMLAVSRRSLERRFKKATCNTVTEYIQRVKIEAAKQSLELPRENVSEVMYKIGYTDPKAFRTTFKRITGLSPVQYRNKYTRLNAE